jgi:hypothetical protein
MSGATWEKGGKLPRRRTARTPGICSATPASIAVMLPLAMEAPTGTA